MMDTFDSFDEIQNHVQKKKENADYRSFLLFKLCFLMPSP